MNLDDNDGDNIKKTTLPISLIQSNLLTNIEDYRHVKLRVEFYIIQLSSTIE